ncbi:MAG: co-chaperone DjlA [Gammaproteobacteria bacterium CG11_big_fil_rev_8_21_14_0_20_46_22]|nr:MAG: co-chaperone DjlA [Gammaproteobacteria bacterium CG12_big_fil_rev_8_21_14_0_65_46_12]PIR11046.1 MAG: co-chaperone DjlA [Gammaproteobacteria bacterium CG11_big_fil_rev_8_21_14_0_20_46_22]
MLNALFYRHKAMLICGLIGLIFGPVGLVFGLIIGFMIDRGRPMAFGNRQANQAFFEATFLIMGYLSKADGQVSDKEIQYARQVMKHWHLSPRQTEEAMRLFYQGKNQEFDRYEVLKKLRQHYGHRPRMLAQFINIQARLCYINGMLNPQLKPLLQDIAAITGLGPLNFAYYDLMFGWKAHFEQARRGGYQHQQGSGFQQRYTTSINEAYKILGVNQDANKNDVKRAYRKLMSQYHPDKLMSKGLSEAEMQAATEKAQKIKAAYEQICQEKSW